MENDQEARRNSAEARQIELETAESGGGIVAKNHREQFHCISIIGQIEGHFLLPEGQKATKYEQLLPLLETHKVTFVWVKGHAGHPFNERCDALATAFADKIKCELA